MTNHCIQEFAAIVLAAGSSTRMPGANKLLAQLNDRPLITHVFNTIASLGLKKVTVVTGFDYDRIAHVAAPFGFDVIHNKDHMEGMGTSIATGTRHLPPALKGCFIVLGDIPCVRANTYAELATHLARADNPESAIAVPIYKDRRGHPVLFGRKWFVELKSLSGEIGAREILDAESAHILKVPVPDPEIFKDLDTVEDFTRWTIDNA